MPRPSLQRSGDCTVVRAAGALSRTRSAELERLAPGTRRRTAGPPELPSGKSLNRKRGTPQCSTMSFAQPMITVGMPCASRCRATRLTVWWHTGQVGTSTTASTPSSRQRRRSSGASVSDRHPVAAVRRRAVDARRQRPDPPRRHRLLQAREREVRVDVLGRRVQAVVADVRDAQVGLGRPSGSSTPGRTWRRRCRARPGPGRRPPAGTGPRS